MTTNNFLIEFAKVFEKIGETQTENIHKAATWVADAVMADRFAFAFGSGHSFIPTMDVYPRIGSFPGWVPIHELATAYVSSLTGDMGFRQSLFLEKVPGYARVVLDNYNMEPKDVMVLISNSGCNTMAVEMAEEAHAKGLKTIAITSVVHSTPLKSYAPSGKKLMEVCDLVIDTCVPRGDAIVEVPFLRSKVSSASIIASCIVMQSIATATAEIFAERKFMTPIFPYANDKMSPEEVHKMMDDYYAEDARRNQKLYR
jgi:uncharacterized phosphosugar-binding protein